MSAAFGEGNIILALRQEQLETEIIIYASMAPPRDVLEERRLRIALVGQICSFPCLALLTKQ